MYLVIKIKVFPIYIYQYQFESEMKQLLISDYQGNSHYIDINDMVREFFVCFVFITSLHKKYVIKINLFVLRLMGNKLLTNRKQLILLTLTVIKRSRLHFLLFMQILRALLYEVQQR